MGSASDAKPKRRSPACGTVFVQGAVTVLPDAVLAERKSEWQLGRPDHAVPFASSGSTTAPFDGSSMSVCRRMLMRGRAPSPAGHPASVPLPNTRSLVPDTPGGTYRGPPSILWLEFGIRQSGN